MVSYLYVELYWILSFIVDTSSLLIKSQTIIHAETETLPLCPIHANLLPNRLQKVKHTLDTWHPAVTNHINGCQPKNNLPTTFNSMELKSQPPRSQSLSEEAYTINRTVQSGMKLVTSFLLDWILSYHPTHNPRRRPKASTEKSFTNSINHQPTTTSQQLNCNIYSSV